jgi:hypothetical protein
MTASVAPCSRRPPCGGHPCGLPAAAWTKPLPIMRPANCMHQPRIDRGAEDSLEAAAMHDRQESVPRTSMTHEVVDSGRGDLPRRDAQPADDLDWSHAPPARLDPGRLPIHQDPASGCLTIRWFALVPASFLGASDGFLGKAEAADDVFCDNKLADPGSLGGLTQPRTCRVRINAL